MVPDYGFSFLLSAITEVDVLHFNPPFQILYSSFLVTYVFLLLPFNNQCDATLC